MIKVVVAVIIAILLLKFLRIVLIAICSEIRISQIFPKRKSEYREAFEMECSEQMIKEDAFAWKLHKAILKIDKENRRLKQKQDSLNKRLSNLS
jgi:hypothetical protein